MKQTLEQLYKEIWNQQNFEIVKEIINPIYTVYRDAGDAWEGKSLDHQEYQTRIMYTKTAFPDLVFTVEKTICENHLGSVLWFAEGRFINDLPGLKATGKPISFHGQTIYQFENNKLSGHWQVMDRLGFFQSLK